MDRKVVKYKTVLWADDDADDLNIVREIITTISDQYQLQEASNGKEALAYLRSAQHSSQLPCLVVLDINMPQMNGKEALTIIKNEKCFSNITVAVFTTSSNENDRLFCSRFGVPMFTKPNSYKGFLQMVALLLDLCNDQGQDGVRLN